MIIGFVGGTGPAGTGLAARFAKAGYEVAIGSRDPDRAAAACETVRGLVSGAVATGGRNREVVGRSDVTFLTLPPVAHDEKVALLADALAGRVVVALSNPITVGGGVAVFSPPAEGSLAELVAARAPEARVVGAFHEVHVRKYAKVDRPIDADTVVCSDDEEAKQVVLGLVPAVEGMRGVDGGPLANARHCEAFVAVLVSINLRNKVSASMRITGLA